MRAVLISQGIPCMVIPPITSRPYGEGKFNLGRMRDSCKSLSLVGRSRLTI